MAEYGKVYKKVWRQGRFRSMSERARLLLMYLWCGPHANSIGLYVLPPEYIASDFQWSIDELSDHFRNSSETVTETVRQTVSKPFDELLRNGWVQYDAQSNVILIDSWYNGEPKPTHTIQNQNQLKRALVDVSELPRTQLVSVLIEQASATDSGVPERYLKPFVEQLRERLPKPLGKQLPKQFRNGLRECEINSKKPFRNIEAVAEAEAEDETVAVANATGLNPTTVSTPDQEVKDPPPGAHPRERRDVQRIFGHLQMQVGNWNVCIAGSRPWHWIERIIDRFGDDRVLLVADKIAQFYAERGKIPPATTDKARQKLWEWLEREELGEQRQSRSHDALISDLTKGRG